MQDIEFLQSKLLLKVYDAYSEQLFMHRQTDDYAEWYRKTREAAVNTSASYIGIEDYDPEKEIETRLQELKTTRPYVCLCNSPARFNKLIKHARAAGYIERKYIPIKHPNAHRITDIPYYEFSKDKEILGDISQTTFLELL